MILCKASELFLGQYAPTCVQLALNIFNLHTYVTIQLFVCIYIRTHTYVRMYIIYTYEYISIKQNYFQISS